MAANVMQK